MQNDYENARGVALMQLHQSGARIFDAAVELAFKGPWRERSERAPAGTVVNVTRQTLRDTGNPDIIALVDAYDALKAAWQAVRSEGN